MILYQVNLAYERQTGEDNPGFVKESYLVEGVNPSDVENRLMEEIKKYIAGDYEIKAIIKRQFVDIIENPDGDRWYKAKVEMITIDEDKEIRRKVNLLVQAKNFIDAQRELYKALNSIDCEVVGLELSPILEIYRATKSLN